MLRSLLVCTLLGVLSGPVAAQQPATEPPGQTDPALFAEVQAYMDGMVGNPGTMMGNRYDTEGGFVWVPDNSEVVVTDKEVLDGYAQRYSEGWQRSEGKREVMFARDLGNGYVTAATHFRTVTWREGREPRYQEFRTFWVLRRTDDGFKVAQSMDGMQGMTVMVNKLYREAARAWDNDPQGSE